MFSLSLTEWVVDSSNMNQKVKKSMAWHSKVLLIDASILTKHTIKAFSSAMQKRYFSTAIKIILFEFTAFDHTIPLLYNTDKKHEN